MPLSEEQVRFVESGVSITAGSRDRRLVPSVMKALGARVDETRCRVTLLLSAAAARQLLADVGATGTLAVVFSLPSTHHTIQLKGRDAREAATLPGDAAIVAAHREAFADELVRIGHRRDWALSVHDPGAAPLAAVAFTVEDVFAQTPGPGAGARLGASR